MSVSDSTPIIVGFKETSPLYGTAMSPVVEGGLLIAHVGGHGDGALTAFDAATGAVRWAWKGDGPGYASPVVGTIGGARQVVTQSQDNVVGLSAEKGELLWKIPLTTAYEQNAVTPVLAGDLVIYGGLDQPMRAVRVAKKGGAFSPERIWENAEVAAYLSSPVLEGGKRTSTLEAQTACRVAVARADQIDRAALIELARGHRREA